MHKMTKLKVLPDAVNKHTNKQLIDANGKQAKKLLDLGFISGGIFHVEEGDTYIGTLRAEPKVGERVFIDGEPWFMSSNVVAIENRKNGVFIIKTENSVYKLEKVKATKPRRRR